jgi:hypothetical protein
MMPVPPMLTGLLSTMFSKRPAVDDVFEDPGLPPGMHHQINSESRFQREDRA